MENFKIYITNDEKETIALGYEFAKELIISDIVLLYGELGAGKTQFSKGICNYFGIEEPVTSPTFTLINQYDGLTDDSVITIYHIDLYRIKDQKEFEEIGLNEILDDDFSIKLIEWPEKNLSEYPANARKVYLKFSDENKDKREIKII
ncbi:tRNA (adenosine(37)-N6)-threonylcarbamoyltransferase complex ATPase subunit type 1 TsaE [Bacteroidetes/Chlorobi group bacterium ChocPot_Mid]|jgi:tRNA threonylcarbamoyladenosine biosynthesis protein TsaE|nr:MAG: tRNA (adenosine(37)-N6)-threonylcarbamoyltransferase complex ATPase subunit type 1 TsaE [Bacteroidetes/Chlorobi group bacterium ChocPot_Mid]